MLILTKLDSQSSRQVSELALELSLELETSLTLTCLSDARLGALKGYLNEKSVSVCVCCFGVAVFVSNLFRPFQ